MIVTVSKESGMKTRGDSELHNLFHEVEKYVPLFSIDHFGGHCTMAVLHFVTTVVTKNFTFIVKYSASILEYIVFSGVEIDERLLFNFTL